MWQIRKSDPSSARFLRIRTLFMTRSAPAAPMKRCPHCDTSYQETGPQGCPACAAGVYRCERCREDYQGGDACPACGHLRVEAWCEQHPDAAALGRCVICGTAVCSQCRAVDQRAHLCREHGSVTVIEGWAQAYGTTSEFEASLIRENLASEGIDARIYSQRDRSFSVDLGELSIVRVLVPVFAYQQAREILDRHLDEEGELAFACASCGEAYEVGALACLACGTPLGGTGATTSPPG